MLLPVCLISLASSYAVLPDEVVRADVNFIGVKAVVCMQVQKTEGRLFPVGDIIDISQPEFAVFCNDPVVI
jgi:hypothetical protein